MLNVQQLKDTGKILKDTEHSASLIDNILTTDIFNNSLKKGIIKSDHFPIFFSVRLTKEKLQ